jgi:acid stress chaperone HdeB
MPRLLCCFAIVVLNITAASADDKPQNIDLASFTCKDFQQGMQHGHEREMRSLAMWLDGYLSGISGNTEVNWQELKQYTDDLITYCRSHPASVMQEAARKAGM